MWMRGPATSTSRGHDQVLPACRRLPGQLPDPFWAEVVSGGERDGVGAARGERVDDGQDRRRSGCRCPHIVPRDRPRGHTRPRRGSRRAGIAQLARDLRDRSLGPDQQHAGASTRHRAALATSHCRQSQRSNRSHPRAAGDQEVAAGDVDARRKATIAMTPKGGSSRRRRGCIGLAGADRRSLRESMRLSDHIQATTSTAEKTQYEKSLEPASDESRPGRCRGRTTRSGCRRPRRGSIRRSLSQSRSV